MQAAIEEAIDIKGCVEINAEECKGCGLCVEACAQKVLSLAPRPESHGYHPAQRRKPCNGCGLCLCARSRAPSKVFGVQLRERIHAETTDQGQQAP